MRKLGGVVLVAAVLLFAGCSADAASEEPPASPSAEAPSPSPSATADALQSVREAYVAAGGQCSPISVRDTAVSDQAGDCSDGALLTTYSSESQRDSAIDALEELQVTNPSSHTIAVGPDWIVNGGAAESVAETMGGVTMQIGEPGVSIADYDITTDAGLCAADAELSNLELNDLVALLLDYPADRDLRTSEDDEAIRAYKNEAFLRECPERAG